jgi:hypothetical protein
VRLHLARDCMGPSTPTDINVYVCVAVAWVGGAQRSGGAFMFAWGLLDLALDIGQSFSLASCGHWWLFACSTTTLLVTTAVCVLLGSHILSQVAISNEDARAWLANHGKLTALVVMASASRLESVAVLRLRLCEHDLIDLPIQPAYFHFIRHAGMFHYLLEDFPHGLVGIAQLSKAGEDTCGTEHGTFAMPIDAKVLTSLNVVFSLGSIGFGIVLRSTQMLVLRSVARGGAESTTGSTLTARLINSGLLQAPVTPVAGLPREDATTPIDGQRGSW